MPTFRDFRQEQSLSGELATGRIFSVQAQDVLNRLFPSGYDPDETRNNIHYYITGYQSIPSAQKNLLLEVAVMLSNPEPTDRRNAYRLRWVARKKSLLDPEWATASEAPEVRSVQAFLAHLKDELGR
jgi:hypothetical protein